MCVTFQNFFDKSKKGLTVHWSDIKMFLILISHLHLLFMFVMKIFKYD